jgi:pSer/pThr/pTyr-binding forkhead associated (FHA) protein
MPQPSVTIMPPAPKQEPPPAPKQPQHPPTPVYKPPVQPPAAPTAKTPPPAPKPIQAKPAAQPAFDPKAVWGNLLFGDGQQVKLSGARAVVGRYDHDLGGIVPEVDLSKMQGSDTVSRIHAAIEHIGSTYTVTDLNSTNSTRLNGKRLEPDKAVPINDGDTIQFGKVNCTFKKV